MSGPVVLPAEPGGSSNAGRQGCELHPIPIPQVGTSLTDADLVGLSHRWIDAPLAEASAVRRVDSETGSGLVGRSDRASYSGLAIPYFLPGEAHVREWRLRRDEPELEYKDGRYKECRKYLSPPRAKSMLYFVPGLLRELLQDTSIPIVITEGEFKTLALWRLANFQTTTLRFLPVGLPGVWNWRGTVGKAPGPNGERLDVKGSIPDLDLISWNGRRVIIAFDADSGSKQQVDSARNGLARELSTREANVGFPEWAIAEGKGIDDLLANVGPEKVLALLDGVDCTGENAQENISVDAIAAAILTKHSFAGDLGDKLHFYRNGCYHPKAEQFIAQQVKYLFARMKLSSKWSSHKSDEIARYLAIDAPLLWSKPPLDRINVQNGLLDVATRSLLPHSSDFLSTVQLPVTFDPDARCPAWDDFVRNVFPSDSQAIAWEIPAWLMTPDTSIQKAILLFGDGANGKSTYLRGLLAFLGKQNTSAVSLQKLESDRFSVARLIGRLANVCPDLPSTDLTSTSIFKAITGGDPLMAEYKFRDAFEFMPFARLVFSANHLPRSADASAAFFRRWLVVPFERTFSVGEAGTIPGDRLDALLSDPKELSGLLNKALEALHSIRTQGLSQSESMCRALDEFRQTTDPLSVWLDSATATDAGAVTSKEHLYSEYYQDCTNASRPPLGKTAFGRALKKLRPALSDCQKTIDGAIRWCYVGISLVTKLPRL